MPLTDIVVKNAKPKDKPYKLSDAECMYLYVSATGKYWRYDYSYLGKRKTLALGVYPTISLAEAREGKSAARKLLAKGIDPSKSKISKHKEAIRNASVTFEIVAREWHQKNASKWSEKNTARTLSLLERNIFPFIGKLPIADVKPSELLETIQRIEKRGTIQTAHRAMMNCGQIFRYAIATDRAHKDISLVLRGSLTPIVETHHASITDPKKIGDLLKEIEQYEGLYITKYALKLAPLLFVRPGELRHAEWVEFNFDSAEWKIPANKMKMGSAHIVPLSKQSLSILNELKDHTGHLNYLFPSLRTPDRPMSDNTVNAALRRLGYEKDEMTGHGFRSMASTILHEQGWPHDAIERQLAHAEKNKVVAAYNYADYLPKRREMMQAWADYLDELKKGALHE
jgi:integrase